MPRYRVTVQSRIRRRPETISVSALTVTDAIAMADVIIARHDPADAEGIEPGGSVGGEWGYADHVLGTQRRVADEAFPVVREVEWIEGTGEERAAPPPPIPSTLIDSRHWTCPGCRAKGFDPRIGMTAMGEAFQGCEFCVGDGK